jgi:hypothetical protein
MANKKKRKIKKGKVVARICKCCGHHEIGVEDGKGKYTPLKEGMKIKLEEV